MKRFCAATLFLAVSLLGIPAGSFADLSARLQASNFNLYDTPSQANDMKLRDLRGGTVNLAKYRGKVVLLNFWKIDCQPCAAEKVILEKLYRKYGARGLSIIAVNLFDAPERIQSYCNQGKFSFAFGIDLEKRFRVQQYRGRSGNPSAFVVNGKNEAIYEVPAVPTTYVVDRNGQVIGNAFGLINWEEQPFKELLETLLDGPSHGPAVAEKQKDFAVAAREGPRQEKPHQEDMPEREAGLPQGPTAAPREASPMRVAQAPALPFQPQQMTVPTVAPQPPVAPPTPEPTPEERQTVKAPEQSATHAPQGPARKKPRPTRAAQPATPVPSGMPQAYTPPQGASAVPSRRPTPAAPVKPPAPAAPPAIPQVPQQAPAVPPRAGNLSPLPPAIPYSPPGSRVQPAPAPVSPDSEGRVLARIPGQPGSYDEGRVGGTPGPNGLPEAQRIGEANRLESFVMDAFGRRPQPSPQGMTRPQPQEATQAPPSSVFGQLNRDLSVLGSGIKDAFSRILPTR